MATGQDGDIRGGIAWPGIRFVDNSDGTITDTLTGLLWTADASFSGATNWQGALDFAYNQNSITYLGYGTWRLPTSRELFSLINYDEPNSGSWLITKGLLNIPAGQFFWTSTTDPLGHDSAEVILFDDGTKESRPKGGSGYAWLVNGPLGTHPALLPQTGQLSCFDSSGTIAECTGTGQDGDIRPGASWPAPRFIANADQTISDNLTGLLWTKDANLMTQFSPGFDADGTARDGAVSWQHALDFVANLDGISYLGYQDWRLPNIDELGSLINSEQPSSAVWLANQGFTDIPSGGNFLWTSTSYPSATGQALAIDLATGAYLHSPKSALGMVWPVRGGYAGDPVLHITPLTIDFGTIIMGGTSPARELVISNPTTKNQNLSVNSLTLDGADKDLFSITPGGANPCPNMTPVIPPGTNCTMTATFAPLDTGRKNATLAIIANTSNPPTVTSVTGNSVDGDPPTGAILINANAQFCKDPAVTLDLSASDNSGTVAEMRFSNDNVTWTPWRAYADTVSPWTLLPSDGLKTVYAQFRDEAGNVSVTYFDNIILRGTPPQDVVIRGLPANGFTSAPVMVLTVSSPDAIEYRYHLVPTDPATDLSGATITPQEDTVLPIVYAPIRTQILLSNLPDGSYSIVVTGRDIAGNEQPFATVAGWTVARTPPALTLNPASIVSPTSIATPILNGTVELGIKTVVVSVGSASGYATVSGTNWNYAIPAGQLANGNNTITITATDVSGNSRTLTTFIVFDNTAPVAAVSGVPANNGTTSATTVTLAVGGTEVVAYKYSLDTGPYSTETSIDQQITLNNLAEGKHAIKVIGKDLAGNWQTQATATSYAWTVDTVPPAFVISAYKPPPATPLTPLSPTSTAVTDITVNNVSETSTFSIRNEANGATLAALTVTSPAATGTFKNLALASGTNRITITARDNAGNATIASTLIELDTTGPMAVINGIINNGDTITVDSTTFTIGGTGVVQYKWKRDFTPSGSVTVTAGTYSNAVDIGTMLTLPLKTGIAPFDKDGTHTLSVIGVDNAGNWQLTANATTLTWTVISTPPKAAFSSSSVADGSVTKATSASFALDSTSCVAYKYVLDNSDFSTAIEYPVDTPIPPPLVADPLLALPDGPHTLFVIGRDAYNNWQKIPTTVRWTVDTSAPALSIDSPVSPTNSRKVTGTTDKGAVVDIYLNGTKKGTATNTDDLATGITTWAYTFTVADLPANTPVTVYTVKAVATDSALNSANTTVALNFDSLTPVVVISGPPPYTTPVATATGATSMVFSVSSSNKTLDTFTYYLDALSASAVELPANQPILLSSLSSGTHTLHVTGKDLAGNSSIDTLYKWTVDPAVVPVAATISGAPAYRNNLNPTPVAPLSLSIGPAGGVVSYAYKLTTKPAGATVAATSPEYTAFPPTVPAELIDQAVPIEITGMPEGIYVLEVYGTANGTDFQPYPTRISWIVDRTPPASVAITGIKNGDNINASSLSLSVKGASVFAHNYREDLVSYLYKVVSPAAGTSSTPVQNPTENPVATPINFTTLPEGDYTIEFLGRDMAGNLQVVPTSISFKVDRTSPIVTLDPVGPPIDTITKHLSGTVDDASAIVTISASWTGGTPVKTVTFGGKATVDTGAPAPYPWSYDLNGLLPGSNSITVTARDPSGNSGITSGAVTLKTDIPVAVVTLTNDATPPPVTNSTAITLKVRGDNGVVIYKYKLDNGAYSAEIPIGTFISETVPLTAPFSHTISVLGEDVAGNWQQAPTVISWTFDASAPSVVLIPAAITSPSNDRTGSFSVGSLNGDIVAYDYKLDGGPLANGTPTGIPVRTPIVLTNLLEGSHTLTVIGKNLAGTWQNIASGTSVTWSLLLTAPVLDIDPINLATPTSAAAIDLSGTVTVKAPVAPPVTTNIATVTVTNSTTNITTAAVITGSAWALPSLALALAAGNNDIVVTATDSAGNAAVKKTSIYRMASAPVATVLTGTPPILTSTTSINLAIGGSNVVSYMYKLQKDGDPFSAYSVEMPTDARLSLTGLSDGTYTLAIIGKDLAGNWQTDAGATTITWSVDTTSPPLTLNQVATPTRQTGQKITGTVEPGCVVKVSTDTAALGGTATVAGPNWQFTINGLAAGPNTITITAIDPAGNTTSVSSVIEFESTTPIATVFGTPPAITRSAEAILMIGGSGVVTYRYSLDNSPYTADTPVGTAISLTALAEGPHTLLVLGKTISGIEQTTPTTITWIVDTLPPVATISGAPPEVSNLSTATFTIGGVDVQAYRYSVDGGPFSAETPVAIDIKLTNVAVGMHTLAVVAKDSIGNWQSIPSTASWTIDLTPPSLTLNPVTARTILSAQKIGGSIEPGASLTLTVDTSASQGAATISGSSWTFQVKNLLLGPNNYTITATDAAGNKTIISTTITRYTAPITTISGVPAAVTNQTGFTFTVFGEEVVAYRYSIDSGPYSDEVDIATPIVLANIGEGRHTVYVIGRDSAGGVQTPPTQASWTVDLSPPTGVTVTGMPPSPTNKNLLNLKLSGTDVAYYQYSLDSAPFTDFVTIATPLVASGLIDGSHTLAIIGKDGAGNIQETATTISWIIDTVPPVTTASPVGGTVNTPQTVKLSMNEPGTIHYTVDGSTPTSSSPSYVSPLAIKVDTNLRYFAIDSAGNAEPLQSQTYIFAANGDINGDGTVDIADALVALKISARIIRPTPVQLSRGDVAPLAFLKPSPDGTIDIGDAVVILEQIVGLVRW
jgi:hypothetical protein